MSDGGSRTRGRERAERNDKERERERERGDTGAFRALNAEEPSRH